MHRLLLPKVHQALPGLLVALLLHLPVHAEEPGKKWFKGNTHTHSLWSDGNDFPEMITDWYQKRGYQFLAISDHNILQAREVWMAETAVEKRRKALGPSTLSKYLDRFGAKWVEFRETNGVKEVRLKKLEEYRPLFERPEEFLLVQAEELSASFEPAPGKKVPIHINGVNLKEEIPPLPGSGIQDVMRKNLQAIREQGTRLGVPVLAHVNHPNFRWALTAEDLAAVLEENFFEIFNGHPMINYLGDDLRPGYETIWDVANTLRLTQYKAPPLYGVATDDAHHYHGEDSAPGRGWVMVHATHLSADKLVEALRAGDFYASSGVTLKEVTFTGGKLHILIQGEPGVTYTTRIVGTPKDFDKSTRTVSSPEGDFHPQRTVHSSDVGRTFASFSGTDVTYQLTGQELYVRAVIVSSLPHVSPTYEGQLQTAWTQPVGWQ